jgi:hypothetical protein
MRWLLVVSVVLILLSPSCATKGKEIALFPIEETDIYYDGENICMSPYYFNAILQAKIK